MPIVIPIAASTFGDSSFTQGDPLGRKYVLAQFRADASFDWVRETRGRLVRDELKFRDFRESEARLRTDRGLWARVENGVGQASIIVIDTDRVRASIVGRALYEGAELRELEENIKGLVEQCATAIVGGTPIAFLPHSLARVVPWRKFDLVSSLDRFTPAHIREQIGGGLKQAQIFAARAHAVFDLATADSAATRTDDVFYSPLSRVMLAELLSTPRSFDIEAPGTVPLLNEAAEEIARVVSIDWPSEGEQRQAALVREVDSRSMDEMQAADVAAGWARELLERGGEAALAARFERVWVNGRRVR